MAFARADEVIAEIDTLAFLMVREINAIHTKGLDLNGNTGEKFFRDLDVQIKKQSTNLGDASAELEVTNFDLVVPEKITFSFNEETKISESYRK